MLVFSPIIKGGEDLLEQNPLPYSLFLIPYWLFKFSSPTVETLGYDNFRNVRNCKMSERIPLPCSLFLFPYWLFKFFSPTVETFGNAKCRNV
jgi:hypothetical protein